MQEQLDEFREREMQTRTMYDNIITTLNDNHSANVRLISFSMMVLE